MKQVVIVAFVYLLSMGQVFSQKQKTVRFDGLYQTETAGDTRGFLRFFSDGNVVSVTSTGEAADVIKWLNKSHKDIGKYEIIGDEIYFTTTSKNGTVVFEGKIRTDYKLELTWKSLINGNVGEGKYYFIKL